MNNLPLDREVRPQWIPDPTIWRWPSYKLRGVEWRYALHRTRENAEPLYSEEDMLECVADAVAAEREACAKVCEDISEKHLASGRYVSVVADHAVRAGGQVDGAEECAAAIRARKD